MLPAQVDSPSEVAPTIPGRPGDGTHALHTLAACLVIASTSWFLLKELGPLLRPLILAIFLAYLIVPIHCRLRTRIPTIASAAVIFGGTLLLCWGLAVMAYGNLVELNDDMPRLLDRARRIAEEVRAYGRAHLPTGLLEPSQETVDIESRLRDSIHSSMRLLVSSGSGFIAEAFVVGVYLVFLLLELKRFPRRIRAGFQPEHAQWILSIIERVNASTTSYLKAKTLTSLATGIPSSLVLWAFGVPYPVMWGVLTFFGNFIPYVGGLVAFVLPVALAFLELEPAWRPCAVVILLVVIQVVTNNFVEPSLTGKAVDLSPVVTMLSLAFWGLCWGVTGMLIAIPLTAMLKIVCENLGATRSLAILMAEGDG
ncbi:AI-2E family transporter [Singulisphaera rosea]